MVYCSNLIGSRIAIVCSELDLPESLIALILFQTQSRVSLTLSEGKKPSVHFVLIDCVSEVTFSV